MYELTLTAGERQAINWVGHRYANGNDLYRVLWHTDSASTTAADWDADCDITFRLRESLAWKIQSIGLEDDNLWPCFAPELAEKMQRFVDAIV